MQHGGQYGGGVYPAPPLPPDHGSLLYGGGPTYASSPGSAPSAPVYAPGPPSYYQPVAPNNPSVPAYNSLPNSSFSEQLAAPSYSHAANSYASMNPNSSLPNLSSGQASNSNSYPNSYAPLVPSYSALGSSYERSGELGEGSYDSSMQQQHSQFGSPGFGTAPQSSIGFESYGQTATQPSTGFESYGQTATQPSTGFESYGQTATQPPTGFESYGQTAIQPSTGYESYGEGNGGYVTQGEQGYGGATYDQRRVYEKTGYDQGTGYGKTGYDRGTGYGTTGSDQGSGYGKPGYSVTDFGNYGSKAEVDRNYDNASFLDVYAYNGGSVEPYGARGIGGSSWPVGGSGSFNSSSTSLGSSAKIARAVPKVEGNADSGGIQKFRVKLLPEPSSTESIKDVVCQIGLDGVRMVDPTTSRTLRIYPLDNIKKWEVNDPAVFTFWAKSSVDIDQRIIQLRSSSATTTAILDTLTAACVQLCEMGTKDGDVDASNASAGGGTSAAALKKGSVLDWVALRARAPTVEEKQHWVPDEAVSKCNSCGAEFGAFFRRHHCRNCGDIFCDKCTRGRTPLNTDDSQPVRVCDRCLAEVTQRLENNQKSISKVSAPQRTHEDLAKKLQEELERNQAGRKQNLGRPASNGNGNSGQTSVLNCSKCGAITLVTGGSRGCPNCGTDSGNLGSSANTASSFGASAGSRGPPHLWSSDGPKSDKTGPKTREVACPTCTVHLQVQVPNFGTETVECGVCQHPFLVSA